jgi:hypothetical protein
MSRFIGFLKADEYMNVVMTKIVPTKDIHDAIRSVNSSERS